MSMSSKQRLSPMQLVHVLKKTGLLHTRAGKTALAVAGSSALEP